MITTYEMFEKKNKLDFKEPAILDYDTAGKILIKYGGSANRSFMNAYSAAFQKYSRREALQRNGELSEKAEEGLRNDKNKTLAELYADHIIIGWEGVTDEKGKPLEFNRENVIKVLLDLEPLFADIMEQSMVEANFAEQERKQAEKN